ncbi:MAG: hypothetical protein O7D94_12530 [Planctomycetota bacterium]|nr:hypothetical protein [Planctomycetota bacterium]
MTAFPTQSRETADEFAESLRTVAINSAHTASRALSKWFKRGVRLTSNGFEYVEIEDLSSIAGPPDEPILAARLPLSGDLTSDILLAFPEKVAMSLVDIMLGNPDGTTQEFSELERSCLQETGNIVGSAFTNCLSNWLKLNTVPQSPIVVHDLACAIIDPLLIGQASVGDRALVSKTEFELDGQRLDWTLIVVPSAESLAVMRRQCDTDRIRRNALQTIAINGAFDASRAMSKWLKRGVRLKTEGFEVVPLRDASRPKDGADANEPSVALLMELGSQLHGHALLEISYGSALELVGVLMGREPGEQTELDEMAKSCLMETGNIISSSFVNSWAKWMEIHSEPEAPQLLIDLHEAIFQSVLVEQAMVHDEVFMSKATFSVDGRDLEWVFYMLPTPSSMRLIEMMWN